MQIQRDELINVLLIEDNPTDVRLVQELLRDAPNGRFTIITASTLAQGLNHLDSDHIDVVLLDLGLPDSQGFDSFRTINTRAPDVPIVVLTVSTDEDLGRRIVLEGAQQFFSKDVLTPDGAYVEMFPRMIRYAIERKRTEEALKEAERLAAIGQTATIIGHDLRNPLQALQFSLELERKYFHAMSPEARDDPYAIKTARLFTNMEQQIRYMDKIVSDLQDYARPLMLVREEVGIAALIGDTLSVLTIPESVSVHVDVLAPVSATIDQHLTQRVLSNLITNAVQAMPDGGNLTVSAAAEKGTITIAVHDTGDGIPVTMKETLFSPLTTGKAKGTGLGLAVVKRIIEAHNGTITFVSEEGKGTTFTVRLPQHPA